MNASKSAMDLKGVLILIILCASWGLNQVAIKVAIQGISPVLQAGIRSLGAGILVFFWMRFRGTPIFRKDQSLWWGLVIGLLFSAEFILIYWGLEYTSASRSAIFLNTSPFVVALGAQAFVPGERLTRIQVAGLGLAFAGIVIVFRDSLGLESSAMLIGDAMLLGAALFWGSVTVIIKASPLSRISPGKVLLYQLMVSGALLPPASLALGEPGIVTLSSQVISCLAYQIIWVAFITYLVWFWLIATYPVSRIAPFTFLSPLFGVMAGLVLLGEPATFHLAAALALVGTGIYLVNRK